MRFVSGRQVGPRTCEAAETQGIGRNAAAARAAARGSPVTIEVDAVGAAVQTVSAFSADVRALLEDLELTIRLANEQRAQYVARRGSA